MTMLQLKKLIKVRFNEGLDELKYDTEGLSKDNYFKIEETLGKVRLKITVERQSISSREMLISPKLLRRLEVKIVLQGKGGTETYCYIKQNDKNNMELTCYREELPDLMNNAVDAVHQLLQENLDRVITLKS